MSQTNKCSQCLNVFTTSKIPRRLPCCNHNICEPCLKQIIDTKQQIIVCAFCSSEVKQKQIIVFPLNTSILLSQSELQRIKLKSSTSLEEEQQQGDLLRSDANIEQNQEWCQIHKTELDVICISDKQKICPHCALFGNHKNHRFKRVEDFQKEIFQKCEIFKKIEEVKQHLPKTEGADFHNIFEKIFQNKKIEMQNQINSMAATFIDAIIRKKDTVIEQLDSSLKDIEQNLKNIPCYLKYQKTRYKMQDWSNNCQQNINKIYQCKRVQDKIQYFYDSPLQIVSEGYVYIEEMCKYRESALNQITDKIGEICLLVDNKTLKMIDGLFKLSKSSLASFNLRTPEIKIIEQESEDNPFLNCTASQIPIASQTFILNNNNSIQFDLLNIGDYNNRISETPKINKKHFPTKQQTKEIKISDHQKNKANNILPKQITVLSPRNCKIKGRRSEILLINSPPKVQKILTSTQIALQPEIKTYSLKQPQKIYAEFSKNTLTDFFDLSQCNLLNDKAIEYVHRARKTHKIKGLKLCKNQVTTTGFQKMIQFLQGICNINLANNQVSQAIFDVILKNRDKLESLRVLNLTHNPIHIDKKAANKMEEVKRMGIKVVI